MVMGPECVENLTFCWVHSKFLFGSAFCLSPRAQSSDLLESADKNREITTTSHVCFLKTLLSADKCLQIQLESMGFILRIFEGNNEQRQCKLTYHL